MYSALCHSGGLLKNLIDNLDGKNGNDWLEILRRTLRRENPFELPIRDFKPSFSVKCGPFEDVNIISQLQRKSHLGIDALDHFRGKKGKWFDGEIVVDVAIVTPRMLGFTGPTQLLNLLVRAEGMGLELCFDSTAPLALLQHPKVFEESNIIFASDHIKGRIWCIRGDDVILHLNTFQVWFTSDFDPDSLWAFHMARWK